MSWLADGVKMKGMAKEVQGPMMLPRLPYFWHLMMLPI
jgi:hypothetical protein